MTSRQVWLLGGASGTGKSRIAYPLARSIGVPIVEVDDIVEALLSMTTPEQQPALHFWRAHPEAADLAPDDIVELQIAFAQALVPAIEAVVGNHLETKVPVIIEGDYLLPSLAAQPSFGGQRAEAAVRAVFLLEADERRLAQNYRDREPDAGVQAARAAASRRYGEWLAREATHLGLPVVPARPWKTACDRVLAAFRGQ